MGYYSNKLTDYNSKYDDATSKLDSISTKLTALKDSFNGAIGTDIEKIVTDLNNLISNINNIKSDITYAQEKSNRNVTKADSVLTSATLNRATGVSGLDENDSCTFNDAYPPTSYEDGFMIKGVPPTIVFIDHNDELIHSKDHYEKIRESDNVLVEKITKEYYIESYNLLAGYLTWSNFNSYNSPSNASSDVDGGGGSSGGHGFGDYGGSGGGHGF